MNQILERIKSIAPLSESSVALLKESFVPLEVKKKTLLITPECKDSYIYLIECGIARAYTVVDGKEVTSWFSKEGDMVYSTNQLYGTIEGYESETVQVLEDSLLYRIRMDDLEELCRMNIEIANWIRILYRDAFLAMERRLIYRLYYSAESRYADLMKNEKELFQRVNLGHIASYLGISQVTLCALRKRK